MTEGVAAVSGEGIVINDPDLRIARLDKAELLKAAQRATDRLGRYGDQLRQSIVRQPDPVVPVPERAGDLGIRRL